MVSVPPSVLKSHIHAQGMIGKDKVVIPGEGASEADWAAFHQKLGAPADGKGYEFAPPQIEGADGQVIANLTDGFRDAALKAGLSKKQAETVYGWYLGAYADELNAVNEMSSQAMAESAATLKAEYGDNFERNIKLANTLVERYGDEKTKAWLEASGAGNNPEYIRLMVKIAGQFSEDVLKLGTSGVLGGMTTEEAEREINKLMGHPGYLDGQHPEHKDILERKLKLQELIHGTTPVGYRGGGTAT
jgi:hypothetical protein